jgi:PST family polysaccharide transporter
MAFLFIMAPEAIYTLWGDQWTASIPVFRVLCSIGAVSSVIATTGSVFLSLGRADILLKVGGFNAFVMCLGIACGIPWGIVGVAIGYSLSYLIIVTPLTLFVLIVKLLDGKWSLLWMAFRKAILVAVLILILTYFLRRWMHFLAAPLLLLCVAILCSAVYAVLIRLYFPEVLFALRGFLPSRFHMLFDRTFFLYRNNRMK